MRPLFCTLLLAVVGCQSESTSISSGPFTVDGKTRIATGEALGVHFTVARVSVVQSTAHLKAGRPEHTSAQTEVTLADDAVIKLEMIDDSSIYFKLNEIDFGVLNKRDKVEIDEERNVTVNGVAREAKTTSPP